MLIFIPRPTVFKVAGLVTWTKAWTVVPCNPTTIIASVSVVVIYVIIMKIPGPRKAAKEKGSGDKSRVKMEPPRR